MSRGFGAAPAGTAGPATGTGTTAAQDPAGAAGRTAAEASPAWRSDVVFTVEHVSVTYAGERAVRAVRDVSFELHRGEVLGIAGESGCGKSTLAYAITRMLTPPARLTSGRVRFFGRDGEVVDVTALHGERLRRFRWAKVSMVFQSAMNALNPVTTVGRQFADIFADHRPGMDARTRDARARELLEMVGLDPRRMRSYPHELSGGMRQRVAIAMALALEPEIVVMDEPTTALDVVVQREILDEIERLRDELGFSVVFITHDVSLLVEISDRIAVMYAGTVVEHGPADQVHRAAAHPYTAGLFRSFPPLRGARRTLHGIPGSPPDLREQLVGCPFAPRCAYAFDACRTRTPALLPPRLPSGAGPAPADHAAACHLHDPELHPSAPPAGLGGGPGAGGAAPGAATTSTRDGTTR